MNTAEIGLLAGFCTAVLIILLIVYFCVLRRKKTKKDLNDVDSLFPLAPKNLPVPKYIQATRNLPETKSTRQNILADEELRDDYPVR